MGKSDPLSDADITILVIKAKNGDDKAFQALWKLITPTRNILIHKYRRSDLEMTDFEAIAMEAFYQALLRYDPDRGSIIAIASTVIERKFITTITKRLKDAPLRDSLSTDSGEYDSDASERLFVDHTTECQVYSIFDEEAADQQWSTMRKCLSELEQKVFNATVELGSMNYKDIAAHTGLKVKTVDNALLRIKQKLRARAAHLIAA